VRNNPYRLVELLLRLSTAFFDVVFESVLTFESDLALSPRPMDELLLLESTAMFK
jgi:hypothetical protein